MSANEAVLAQTMKPKRQEAPPVVRLEGKSFRPEDWEAIEKLTAEQAARTDRIEGRLGDKRRLVDPLANAPSARNRPLWIIAGAIAVLAGAYVVYLLAT